MCMPVYIPKYIQIWIGIIQRSPLGPFYTLFKMFQDVLSTMDPATRSVSGVLDL